MRIYVYLHLICPEHNAGSETTVYAAMRAMAQRGHKVTIICDRSHAAPYDAATLSARKLVALRRPINLSEDPLDIAREAIVFPSYDSLTADELTEVYEWAIGEREGDGIQVVRPPRRGVQTWMNNYVQDADLLVTHLDLTSQAMGLALDTQKPLVHFVHNPDQLYYWHVEHRIGTAACRLVVMNTDWLAEHYNWPGDQVTCRPVVEPEYYRCERGDSITLVNPTSGKGAPTFYKLARMMPQRSFLTAQGGYGIQEKCQPQNRSNPSHVFYDDTGTEFECFGFPNVTHLKNDPDVRNIFRRTKVLLMPSLAESYGRVAVEAACAGIPTIAHPTLGLQEALGEAGIFYDRDDITSWFEEIERLFTDEIYYRKRSDMALALADTLTPQSEFDRLEQAFIETVEKWQHRGDSMAKMWTADRRIYYDKNRNMTINPNEAVSLCCGVGGRIPEEDAIKLGLVAAPTDTSTPAIRVTPELDTKALSEPQENKAIEQPAETKKRGRKTKAA